MKASTWARPQPFPPLALRQALPSLAACLALALLLVLPALSGALLALLALSGIAAALRGAPVTAEERHWAWLCLLIPAAYLLNMALTGWAMHLLDRPMHLAYGVLLALLLSRSGLDARQFATAAVVAALAAGAVAIYEREWLDQARVFGLGGRWNAVPFGNFSLLAGSIALAASLAMRELSRHPARWLAAGLLAFAAGLYASMSSGARGGWLALPVLTVLATYAGARLQRRHRLAIVAALLLAAVGAFSASTSVRERLDSAVSNVSAFLAAPDQLTRMDNASGIRLAMWRWGIARFVEHPLRGIGYADYPARRAEAVAEGEMPAHFNELANLHNELISTLACSGLPGGLALLAFWGLALRFFVRRLRGSSDPVERCFATAGLLALVGTALFSMTEGLFGTRSGTYGLALMLALPAGGLFHLARQRKQRSGE